MEDHAEGSKIVRKLIILGLLAALAGLATLTAMPAGAVVSGQNGRILFASRACSPSTRICTFSIVAADPNDTNETLLAGPYPSDAFDDQFIANWSPDGKTVVFMAYQGIWAVNADGTGLHELFAAPADTGVDDGPSFTPDGKHIVFTRCCPQGYGYSLWMINADGSGLKDVTKEPGDAADTTPQVSPDGKRIVFNRCFSDQPCEVATVNINGTNLRDLTDNTLFPSEHPNWSPDSKKIVFATQATGSDIAMINADGTGLTQLTFNTPFKSFSFDPVFSPDGTKILFSQYRSTGGVDLYTMNPDGTGVSQVTRTPTAELWPQWAVAS